MTVAIPARPEGFTPVPSAQQTTTVSAGPAGESAAVAYLVTADTPLPEGLGVDRDALTAAGLTEDAGSTVVVPRAGAAAIVVELGKEAEVTVDGLRNAAAAAVRAVAKVASSVGILVPEVPVDPTDAAAAVTEGALLGRYRYTALKSEAKEKPLESLAVEIAGADAEEVAAGIGSGVVTARAAAIARDLANTPPGHLSAVDLADVTAQLAGEYGFESVAFGKDELIEMGCGGILGVNAGSAFEPRLIKLHYAPDGEAAGHLGLVGKGIMYDSGGISLKPSNPLHLLMKMDMGGAAAIVGTFAALRDAGVDTEVTAWLCCTDNMPSGSATKLGDVLTARNGMTVEVKNTDAEGRLVMMDGLSLAVEEGVDAVIDIATLTGASIVALGTRRAALFGTDRVLLDTLAASSEAVDEPVWEMPLEASYRKELDSQIADISNMGGQWAGATAAALFLKEFTGDTPWAHVDIAGPMSSDADDAWRSAGATGFGARLLLHAAADFAGGE